MSIIKELNRRNVTRVAVAYLVASWLLIEASSLILDIYGAPVLVSQIIVALIAIGFPIAMFFAWAFEITPEGIKREHEVERDESITHMTAKKLDLITIVMVVLAAGLLIADRFIAPSERSPSSASVDIDADGRASVAVLPFVNMSGSEENEYFSDGLTETLLHMLAQVDQLRVPARTSSFAFKGTNTDVREIAAQLNVSTILEGSVQRAGQRVRVTAQLVDAADGSHIWSQNFDRDLDDIFAIQDEIANAVATALTESLLGEALATETGESAGPNIASVSTTNTEAYDHYLRGLGPMAEFSHSTLPDAERAFKEALLIDSDFREARIALVYTYLSMGGTALISSSDATTQARAVLAPLLASHAEDPIVSAYDAHTQIREARSTRLLEDEEELAYFERIAASIARAPNHSALYWMAADALRGIAGREEERLAFIDRGLEVDPLSGVLWLVKGQLLAFTLDRPDDGLAAFERLREIEPGDPNSYAFTSFIYSQRLEMAQAMRWMAESATVDRQDHELAAFAALYVQGMGLIDEAEAWVARAELLNADGGATQVARLRQLYISGDRDGALALAEAIVRAQVDDRRGRYGMATLIYAWEMQERGRLDEAFALFEDLAPGSTTDPEYVPSNGFDVQIGRRASALKFFIADAEERTTRREVITEFFDAQVPDWREDDDLAVVRFLYELEPLETAAPALARAIRDNAQYQQDDRIYYSFPAFEPLMAHPEVQAAAEAAEATYAEQAELYLEMVERGEIPGA